MLVRDYTKNYGAGQFRGFGDTDWASLIAAGISGTTNIVSGIINAATPKPVQGSTASVGPAGGYIGGAYQSPPPQTVVVQGPATSWTKDPLMLGAIGLGAVGLLFVLKGSGRGRGMGGFGSYRRGRKAHRKARRHSRRR